MKHYVIFLALVISSTQIFGQDNYKEYSRLVKKADSLYKVKDYKNAAVTFSEAFKSIGWKGSSNDRYKASRSWALAGVADSAFFQLDNITKKQNFSKYEDITNDDDLKSLHNDKRWEQLLQIIKQNKHKAEANKALTARLDSIFIEDQKYRQQIDTIEKKYGWGSVQMKSHLKLINTINSVNLIKVKAILDKNGWLGADAVGANGNLTLFLVIQHADLETQEKYLPMMRESVKNGKASAYNLALLEDRVALRQGKKQIYGSQIARDSQSNTYYVSPLQDPDNVDRRRAAVGLGPLAEYVKQWKIEWNVDQYKKDLPVLEAKEKTKRN